MSYIRNEISWFINLSQPISLFDHGVIPGEYYKASLMFGINQMNGKSHHLTARVLRSRFSCVFSQIFGLFLSLLHLQSQVFVFFILFGQFFIEGFDSSLGLCLFFCLQPFDLALLFTSGVSECMDGYFRASIFFSS